MSNMSFDEAIERLDKIYLTEDIDSESGEEKFDGTAESLDRILAHRGISREQLTTFTVPDDVFKLGAAAFRTCTNLVSVTLPEGLTKIGESAFYGCTNLKSIVIPDGVKEIGAYAFTKCASLESANIPCALFLQVGYKVFIGCKNLNSVIIQNPEGFTTASTSAWERRFDKEFLPIVAIENLPADSELVKYVADERRWEESCSCIENKGRGDLIPKFFEYLLEVNRIISVDDMQEYIKFTQSGGYTQATKILLDFVKNYDVIDDPVDGFNLDALYRR